jgi:hypothetical protein
MGFLITHVSFLVQGLEITVNAVGGSCRTNEKRAGDVSHFFEMRTHGYTGIRFP